MKKLSIEEIIAAIILGTMAVIAFVNTMSRYLFKLSIAATEEIVVNAFVWLTVIGIAIAFKRGSHLNMTFLVGKLPKTLQRILAIFSLGLTAVVFVIVDYYLVKEIQRDMFLFQTRTEALNVPVWIYTSVTLALTGFVFKEIAVLMISQIKQLLKGEADK